MNIDFSKLFSIQGKTALVTGGSRGIGEMIAAGFLANGAKVYISSRKVDACNETAERLGKQFDGQCISIPSDLSGLEGVQHLADEIGAREEALDILVNNAGAAWGASLEEFPESGWDKVMDVNVKGVFFLTQKLLPLLRASASAEDPARIINIGSIDGLRTPLFDTWVYPTSKAALHHLTRVLAAKLAPEHILANAIAPGPFPTWMMSTGAGFGGKIEGEGVDWGKVAKLCPSGRVGRPEDVAGVAIFLSSQAGAYVTGETIALDGGIVVSR